jgi:hypothetical protein
MFLLLRNQVIVLDKRRETVRFQYTRRSLAGKRDLTSFVGLEVTPFQKVSPLSLGYTKINTLIKYPFHHTVIKLTPYLLSPLFFDRTLLSNT